MGSVYLDGELVVRSASLLRRSRWGHAHSNPRVSCATTTGVRTEFGRPELSVRARTATANAASVEVSKGKARAIELTRKENQVIVFAGSKGERVTWADPKFSHDAFTLALIEGFGEEWRVDPYRLAYVTYKALGAWIPARIPVQTQNKTNPSTHGATRRRRRFSFCK